MTKTLLENDYIAVKQCKHGLIAYNVNDTLIGKSLAQYGEWCDGELEILKPLIQEGDVIVDGGANIGSHTVFFGQAVGATGSVIAVEPQRLLYQTLCTNITLNCLVQVRPLRAALGAQPGSAQIPLLDPRQKFNFGAFSLEQPQQGEAVPVIAIDQLGLPSCKLIKIDVEGLEAEVLQGAKGTIARHQPILYVENDKSEGSREILEVLEGLGYESWWHFTEYHRQDNFFDSDEPFYDGIPPAVNLICFPKGTAREEVVGGLTPVEGVEDNWEKAYIRTFKSDAM